MDYEYTQALREALVREAIKDMDYHACITQRQNLSTSEKHELLVMSGFLFYWQLAWKWHYRKVISPWDDWKSILNNSSLSEESIQAGVTSPWLTVNDRVAASNKLSVTSLAKYMASLQIKQMEADISRVKQGRLLRDQIRLGITDEEITQAYQLFHEFGENLIDCLNDNDIPTLACPWPRRGF